MEWTMKHLMKKLGNNLMETKSDLLLFQQKGVFHLDVPISKLTEDSCVRITFNEDAFYEALYDKVLHAKLRCLK